MSSLPTCLVNELERCGVKLRPVQEVALSRLIDAYFDPNVRVVALKMPTGSGKTLLALAFTRFVQGASNVCAIVRTRSELTPYVYNSVRFFKTLCNVVLAHDAVCESSCELCSLRRDFTARDFDRVLKIASSGIYDPYTLADHCRQLGVCPITFFRECGSRFGLPLTVMTFPWLFDSELRGRMLNSFDTVLFIDEAHNIEDYYLNSGVEISLSDIEDALREVNLARQRLPRHVDVGLLTSLLHALYGHVRELAVKYRNVDDEVVVNTHEVVAGLAENLGYDVNELASELSSTVNVVERVLLESRLVRPYTSHVRKVVRLVSAVVEKLSGGDITFVYITQRSCLAVRRFDMLNIYRNVLSKYRLVVLMSGTLPDREYITKMWGIPEDRLLYIDLSGTCRRDIEKILIASVSSRFEERSEETFRTYAYYVKRVYVASSGVVLVVFPSYDFMLKVYEHVRGTIRNVVYVESRDTKLQDVLSFVRRHNYRCMIFAVADGKLCEGVEALRPDGTSAITDVVICGIPYRKPTQYTQLIEAAIERRLGVEHVWQWRNYNALYRILQALGRAVRTERDRCRLWLIDRRFRSRWWVEKLELPLEHGEEVEDI